MSALLLWSQVAWAHPFALRVVAHDTEVTLDGDQVRVEYVVEVPTEGGGGDPRFALPDELAEGIRLEVDGAPLALQRAREPGVRLTSHALGTRIHLAGTLQQGGALTLSNHNYPDLQGYFAHEFRVSPGWQVLDSSLFERDGDRIVRDRNGRWGAGDDHRVATVTVRRARVAGWVARLGGLSDPRPIQHAMPQPTWRSWTTGGLSPLGLGLATLVAAAVGALARASGPPGRAGAVAAMLVAASVLVPLSAPLAVALAVAVLVCCAVAWWRDLVWLAPLAALPALVAVTGRPGWAGLIAIGGAIGTTVPRPAALHRAVVLTPCAAVALLVLARGMGGFL